MQKATARRRGIWAIWRPGPIDAVLASPPYTGNEKSDYLLSADGKTRRRDEKRKYQQGRGCFRGSETYGQTPGQLGAMPSGEVAAVLTSPPWEDARQQTTPSRKGKTAPTQHDPEAFGAAPGQLATNDTKTFWAAALQVVAQCYALLRPGGHALFVTKMYVRDGQLVPFPDQWRQLCEHVGFVTLHEHHALLSTQHGREQDLFGGADVVRETRRISFFRRTSEKRGAPRIDFETIHCLIKPG